MLPSMGPAIWHLKILHPILLAADKRLCLHLSTTQPFFALAATLTLYAHDIQAYGDISRLFDVFLAESPVFPIYFFATVSSFGKANPFCKCSLLISFGKIVLNRREELFDIPDDEPEMLHSILCKLPKPLDLEGLITKALALQTVHPPETLPIWRKVPGGSVLKTCLRPFESGEVEDEPLKDLAKGEALFKKQANQLVIENIKAQAMTTFQTHKAIIGWTVLAGVSAVAVGYYLGKKGVEPRALWSSLGANL